LDPIHAWTRPMSNPVVPHAILMFSTNWPNYLLPVDVSSTARQHNFELLWIRVGESCQSSPGILQCCFVYGLAHVAPVSWAEVPWVVTFLLRDGTHSAHYAVAWCPSVCLSVTRRYCVETSKRITKLFSQSGKPHNSRFFSYRTYGNIPNAGIESRSSTNISLYLGNRTR